MGKKVSVRKPRPSFELQRRKVEQLLKDHAQAFPQGMQEAYVEANQESRGGSRVLLTEAYFQRYFDDSDEARSHTELEEKLAHIRDRAPSLARALENVHGYHHADAGDRDADHYRAKASKSKVSEELKAMVDCYELGLNLLTCQLYSPFVELEVEFAKPRSVRNEEELDKRNAALVRELQDYVAAGQTPSEAKKNVEALYGVTRQRVNQILELRGVNI